MARSYQHVLIEGNLGGDPEMRYTPNGRPVASVSVATSRSFKDSSDAWQEETTWWRVTVWGDAAERLAERGHKGDFVRASGRVRTYDFDVPGCPKGAHHGWELVADRAEVLGRWEKSEGAGGDYGRSATDAYIDAHTPVSAATRDGSGGFRPAPPSGVDAVAQELDDLPF